MGEGEKAVCAPLLSRRVTACLRLSLGSSVQSRSNLSTTKPPVCGLYMYLTFSVYGIEFPEHETYYCIARWDWNGELLQNFGHFLGLTGNTLKKVAEGLLVTRKVYDFIPPVPPLPLKETNMLICWFGRIWGGDVACATGRFLQKVAWSHVFAFFRSLVSL